MSAARLVMPTRILVVGAGGREHALAWKLAAEPGVNEVIVAPGSVGIAREPRVRRLPGVDPLDGRSVVAAAQAIAAELVVVGPEAPLAAGVADALLDAGFAVFGPTADAAMIESSKAFCRDVAEAAGVPMARGRSFPAADVPAVRAFVAELAADGVGIVVKADGLAAGKGVTVCDGPEAALEALADLTGPVVIEERLDGLELSVIAVCDGTDALALPLARDHKRLLDGDGGPNTGGMGAYSPVPDAPDADAAALLDRFHRPILAELARRGMPFRGALYAGLMLTARGPRLLECNARFGDPETQVILPRLGSALGPVLLAAAQGRLTDARDALRLPAGEVRLPVLPGTAVGIVIAAPGYPDAPASGGAIEGLEVAGADGAIVFHAGTDRDAEGTWRATGGRLLTVVGRGTDLAAAKALAEAAADRIQGTGLQRRRDIASLESPRAERAATAAGVGTGR